ncbi:hypothetical protein OIU78_007433 [Salix suchowensis]|nr:hypothetical protein OIU78_007433 [Salix suchowensis]
MARFLAFDHMWSVSHFTSGMLCLVTTCGLARDALNLLRERKGGYDIVISDVYMPDMDGFKLLEQVGLEMDLPVIMMSVDGETSRVMKGVQHGACDYLLKPIRMKELRNIWQHVFRKKIHEVRDIEILEGVESFQMTRNGSDLYEDGHVLCGEDLTSMKKRKDIDSKHNEKDTGDYTSTKKARVVWSVDLHQKFVKAVNQIGFDKVGPKKILDMMNVPWLTRENVASHLQKYRLYLSRLQKENGFRNPAGGIKQSDSPLRDSAGSFGSRNSINLQASDVSNGSYRFSGSSLVVHNEDLRSHESDRKRVVSTPVAQPKRNLNVDVPNPCILRSSPMEFGHPLAPPRSELDFGAFDSTFPTKYPWCGIPEIQRKTEHDPLHLNGGFRHPPLPGQKQHTRAGYPQPAPAISCALSLTQRETGFPVKAKPSYNQTRTNMANHQAGEPISRSTSTDCYTNPGLQNVEVSEFFDRGLIKDEPVHLNDELRFDYEFYDPTEYSLIDQTMFIA